MTSNSLHSLFCYYYCIRCQIYHMQAAYMNCFC